MFTLSVDNEIKPSFETKPSLEEPKPVLVDQPEKVLAEYPRNILIEEPRTTKSSIKKVFIEKPSIIINDDIEENSTVLLKEPMNDSVETTPEQTSKVPIITLPVEKYETTAPSSFGVSAEPLVHQVPLPLYEESVPDALLPSGFSLDNHVGTVAVEPLPANLLPPGFDGNSVDVQQETLPSSFLPPGFTEEINPESLPPSFLPPGFTEVAQETLPDSFLPPGYKETQVPNRPKQSTVDKLKSSYAGNYHHTDTKENVEVVSLDDDVTSARFGAPKGRDPNVDPLAEVLKDIKGGLKKIPI